MAAYVELIRNTPFLVQIFIFYFSLPVIGLRLTANTAALVAMTVNLGAYASEIIRAGIGRHFRERSPVNCRTPPIGSLFSQTRRVTRGVSRRSAHKALIFPPIKKAAGPPMQMADKIIMRLVEALIPYARNARTHSADQVAQIAGSIREFGFTNPILSQEIPR